MPDENFERYVREIQERDARVRRRIPQYEQPNSEVFNPYERMYSPEYESIFDPSDFADAEDIAASTSRQINEGQFTAPPSQFQNFLNTINTQSPQQATYVQELVDKNPQLLVLTMH